MAPTETLAEQHAGTLNALLAGEVIPFALLTGATPAARRRETLARLASGELGLLVGTHALIEGDVEFKSLAVCIVDEQHRFGVSQRAALDRKGPGETAPHTLHMTATPIPRTLSMTAYGDLDATTIAELPAGSPPGQDLGRRRGEAKRRLRVHPRAAARRQAGIRRLPARRRLRAAAGEGGERRGGAARARGVHRLPRRSPPRADAVA